MGGVSNTSATYVTIEFTKRVYILTKRQIYKGLSKVIITMVLKCMKFTCPTNRKTDACMTKEKKFQNRD